MAQSATSHPPRDRAALLNALADLAGHISDLHDDAARLAMPQAVTMGLLWLRDDAVAVRADANAARAPEPAL
jgi:hypothetical protein